ncbi:interleukin-12 receptor subunit beta-1 isoform X2 [Phasianus colchicus]|uniref:interleukin-12 receptor subunit beta-1 isoform X2 n=1 Tax=Phasianus colchicus TaxID=9054 RepID=UPI00129EA9B1|nr:interleukin-12 receptor subunit beta-1 isoform X2 [Phasianus colchicus]
MERGGVPALRWLLLALALPARGGTSDPPPGLSCFRRCSSGPFTCSWPPQGPAGSTTYVLVFCYVSPQLCQQHDAGTTTVHTLKQRKVYVRTNVTAWVEAHWEQHLERSPNITLHLDEAVKLDPPSHGTPFTKANGRLQLWLPRPQCHHEERPPPHREARFRRVGDHSWMQVMCETGKGEDGEDDPVTCELGGTAAFEVQLRHRTQHWSSHWSDWSTSIFVPEGECDARNDLTSLHLAGTHLGESIAPLTEILESPALSFRLGHLGRNGQRLLQLGWQRARTAQGDVTYTLRAHMPECSCAEEDEVVLGPEETEYNLTICGAAYEIVLTATNAAGTSPARQLQVPAEQHTELSFQNISSVGTMVTARWEAPTRGFTFCSERQRIPGDPRPGRCVQEEFLARSSHWQAGPLEAPACYRLAVHGRGAEQDWATFALQHHFVGNTSLAASVRINASADAAVLLWEPSPRAACPGALLGYRVCHAAEGDNVTYGDVDASASQYALRDLKPGTAYRVGIQEVAAGGRGTCSARWHFQTTALGVGTAVWSSNLKYLGISLGLPAAALIYQLSKKRLHGMLFPPLPKPTGSEALRFSASEMSQNKPWKSFLEPSEQLSPEELLVMELSPEKEAATSTQPLTPQLSPKEPMEPLQPHCKMELPFAYRRQEVLDPEPVGSGGVPTCGPTAAEDGAGSWGPSQVLPPLVQLKPITPQDQEGVGLLQEKAVP